MAGWHHQDIIAGIRKRGSSITRLSVEVGFARTTLCASLYKPHPKAQQAIADFLGVTPHDIWPQWYDKAGKRTSNKPEVRQ